MTESPTELPKKWLIKRLDEVSRIVAGATPKTGEPKYWDGEIFWATPKDLSGLDSKNLKDTTRKITPLGLKSCAAEILPPGSVLFSSRAPIGLTAINEMPLATNQGFKSFVPFEDQIDSNYLYHWLRCNRAYLDSLGNGATFKEVSKAVVSRIQIPLPPLAEQKRIAAILDKADSIRRKLQQSLRLSDDFLRSVFLDMFGDPVTNPNGLKIGRMGDYSDQLTGYAFKSSDYVPAGDGIRLCRGTNVLPSVIDWSDRADWAEDQYSQLERYQLIEGDIVVAMDRPWISSGFKTARITERDVPSLLVQRVARIRAKSPLSNNYLFTLLNQGSFARHCKPTETTIPHISPIELREFPVAIPSKSQLEKFEQIYLKLAHARDAVKRKASDAESLFSSLQQRAFRGEL